MKAYESKWDIFSNVSHTNGLNFHIVFFCISIELLLFLIFLRLFGGLFYKRDAVFENNFPS